MSSETFLEEQIKHLKPYDVLHEGWLPSKSISGRSIYSFPFNLLIVRGSIRNLFPKIAYRLYKFYLKKYLKENKIEAVLANYGPLGANIYEACEELNIPFSVLFHGFDASEKKTLQTYHDAYSKFLPKAKSVLIVSKTMRANLEKIAGPLQNIHVTPCGVDTDIFKPGKKKEGIHLISVGRFVEKKGPLKNIQAFEILLEKFPEATYKMIGDGPLLEKAKEYVASRNLEEKISFWGHMTQEKFLPLLQESNIYIQHSFITPSGDSEGTPVSILEASACGLAVCSTKHAGIPDAVIDGETGILVDEHDIEGMGQALIRMASDLEFLDNLGKKGREHIVKHYNVVQVHARIKALLR